MREKRAIYGGTFDPVTNGPLDIIRRASKIFDEVTIAVADSSSKSPLFSLDVRVNMVEKSVAQISNVNVVSFNFDYL